MSEPKWIETEWQRYRKCVINPRATADQLHQLRKAFISGAFAVVAAGGRGDVEESDLLGVEIEAAAYVTGEKP